MPQGTERERKKTAHTLTNTQKCARNVNNEWILNRFCTFSMISLVVLYPCHCIINRFALTCIEWNRNRVSIVHQYIHYTFRSAVWWKWHELMQEFLWNWSFLHRNKKCQTLKRWSQHVEHTLYQTALWCSFSSFHHKANCRVNYVAQSS